MDHTQIRLQKCFAAVFPTLSQDEMSQASSATVESWDSVAGITLLTTVEEEFGISIEVDELENFTSFPRILSYLERVSDQTQA
jgi:acyl carrier protein